MTDRITDKLERINWVGSIPFFLMHVAALGAFWSGVKLRDVILCVALYYVRMFFITAGYHRYFAHRSYQMGRVMQFLMALGGCTAAQKGPLWWASHHRVHHTHSDTPQDPHSSLKGFWWSHLGWILSRKNIPTLESRIQDFTKYPELRWLDRHYLVPPFLLAVTIFLLGGWSALFVGFFLSTILLYHGTFFINSLAHILGRRRYVTSDNSRNSIFLALITNGEGWHNNHHHYASSARQGFFWWEIDVSYYVLKILSFLKLATNLRQVPAFILQLNLIKNLPSDLHLLQSQYVKLMRLVATTKHQTGEFYQQKQHELEAMIQTLKERMEALSRAAQATSSRLSKSPYQASSFEA